MKIISAVLVAVTIAFLSGCGPRHDHAGHGHGHHHEPPHGGTAVTLGEEDYHLEFVFTPGEGRLRLYVLSAHMADFVRLPDETIALQVRLPDREETLLLKAQANPATGETVGNTALFEAQADWLKSAPLVSAGLKQIEIQGNKYADISVQIEPVKPVSGSSH